MKNYTLAEHFLNEGADIVQEKSDDREKLELPPVVKHGFCLSERWGKNPFRIPSDNEWLNLCKSEKQRLKNLRRFERRKKVHEKNTFRSRYAGSTLPAIKQMFHEMDNNVDEDEIAAVKRAHLSEAIAQTSKMCRVRHVEREFTHELVQRKREMFLVNFAIQTKRNEIESFKDKEHEEEKKVQQIAQRLHEDALLFDEFLKNTDEAAVESMKAAEREARLKFEKITELRRTQAQQSALKAEISKMDELLTDYLRYKSFLQQVHHNISLKTGKPLLSEEWDQKRMDERREKEKRQQLREFPPPKRRPSYIKRKSLKPKPSNQLLPAEKRSRASLSKSLYPEEWTEHPDTQSVISTVGYILDDPLFLMDKIRDMEEENLKQIYHSQYSEEAFDEMKDAYVKVETQLNKEKAILVYQVTRMKELIDEYETRCSELKVMCTILGEGAQENGDEALAQLNTKVAKVYRNVVGRLIVNMDGFVMLTCIESKMDELLDEIESFPTSTVKEIQKIKDKERRLMLREEKMIIQRQKQEERSRRAQERANAGTYKRIGRKLVFRSEPDRSKGKVKVKTDELTITDSVLFFEKE